MRPRRTRTTLTALLAVAIVTAVAIPALGHPEHPTLFPPTAEAKVGHVPAYRTTGTLLVVCTSRSKHLLLKSYGRTRKSNPRRYPYGLKRRLALLRKCRYRSIQDAVNAAHSGYRIQILPGYYTEPKSRAVPVGAYQQQPCPNDYVVTEGFTNSAPPPAGPQSNDPPVRPDRNYLLDCPNSKYLILVNGDTRHEPTPAHPQNLPKCLQLCDLQIEGMGRKPTDVVIAGDRRKVDVIRVDRANGIYLRNFTVENGWFNDIDLVEVNGFVVKDIVARYAQDYGILSFTAVNGLYDHDVAYNNGDSGLYPGSTMKGCDIADPNAYATCESTGKPNADGVPGRVGCQRYSIEIRNSDSYGNTLGYSGTAGNSTWVHDNKFHDNAAGLSTDSFVPGHPGFPQECVKWEHNEIYSNNNNVFDQGRQQYCIAHKFEDRKQDVVCPQYAAPVGTGIIMAGTNRNLIRDNHIYDNWRQGVFLIYVPAVIRADTDPAHQTDTSNGNEFLSNQMGQAPDGTKKPNGVDFTWDGQGIGNCWSANTSSGAGHVGNPSSLPGCPGGSSSPMPTNPAVTAESVPCTAWDPEKQPDPPGCTWFTLPPKP